jgi:choline dehydrogenase-like flavoprotein
MATPCKTAGLTLAGRLSEDPSLSILVLEAGESNLDDPNILLPGQFGKTFGNPKVRIKYSTPNPVADMTNSMIGAIQRQNKNMQIIVSSLGTEAKD